MAKLLWIKQTTPATKQAEAIVHFLRDLKDGVTNNCTQRDVRNKVDLMIKRPPDMTRPAQYRTPEVGEGALLQEHRAAQKQNVDLKPLDHPEFDGKAKNYARFKRRFEEMITPNFEDKLPEAEQLEYSKRAKSYQGSDFAKLKSFL